MDELKLRPATSKDRVTEADRQRARLKLKGQNTQEVASADTKPTFLLEDIVSILDNPNVNIILNYDDRYALQCYLQYPYPDKYQTASAFNIVKYFKNSNRNFNKKQYCADCSAIIKEIEILISNSYQKLSEQKINVLKSLLKWYGKRGYLTIRQYELGQKILINYKSFS